ncbi:MAG: C-GCAxxG-C-C family protein [Pseudomonadota bacterium]
MFSAEAITADIGRMRELAQQGFHCSDMLLLLGIEAQGKTNPDAVRVVSGLAGGVGYSGDICGALTGGVCLLSLYGGRGTPEEEEDPRLRIMISELLDWFTSEQERRYGGIHCREITEDDPQNMPLRCPQIVASVYRKARSILDDHGFEWNSVPEVQEREQRAGTCRSGCPVAARL